MSIQRAEQLKRELTDKFVVVVEGVPELRRFSGLTGQVKTVNMSCRALVQFDGPADIGWYDIDPAYLKLVNAPAPKKAAAHAAPAKTPGEAQGAAPKPVGKSPLELARAQGAQKAGDAPKPAAAAAAPATEGKKLSPLELARLQGAQKSGAAAAPAEKPAPAAATAPAAPAAGGKKLSPLELARQQGAVKAGGAPAAAAPPAATPAPAPAPEPPKPAAPAPKAAAPAPAAKKVDTAKMSTADVLAACRQQGAFKG